MVCHMGEKSWGNAPEIEKRQMIGSEEKNAPVFLLLFSFSEIPVHKLVESIQNIFLGDFPGDFSPGPIFTDSGVLTFFWIQLIHIEGG